MKTLRAMTLLSLSTLLALSRAAPAQQSAPAAIVALANEGITRGAIRAEWRAIGGNAGADGLENRLGELRIFRNADGGLIQSITLTLKQGDARKARLEFKDLDADGYQDLLLEDATGASRGEIRWTEVFMWEPVLARFQHDAVLPPIGEITLGLHPGCVDVTSRCSATAFHRRLYCHEKSEGLWELVKDANCEVDGQD